MSGAQIISIKEARKLLGRKGRELTDAQIRELIDQLDFLATLGIKAYKSNQPKKE